MCTNRHAFCSLPQVGSNRLTAVSGAEGSRGLDSVMDNDSQQACSRAQPQAPDSSPGEVGGDASPESSSGLRGTRGRAQMYNRRDKKARVFKDG